MNKVPDNELANAIRNLQKEIDEKSLILKSLRDSYNPEEIDWGDYLKTSAWQEMRERVFRRDFFRCVVCGESKNLNVHHITYERLGCEDISDLVTLCQYHHEKVHEGDTVENLINQRLNILEAKEYEIKVREEAIFQQENKVQKTETIYKYMSREERELFASVIVLGSDYHDKILPEYHINVYDLEHFLQLHSIVDFVNNGGLLSEFHHEDGLYTDLTSESLLLLPDIVYGENKPQTLEEKIRSYSMKYARCFIIGISSKKDYEVERGNMEKAQELEKKFHKLWNWCSYGGIGSLEVMKS